MARLFRLIADEKVMITGCDIVGPDWDVHNGNIYKTTIASEVLQLFTNGVRVNIARYPNEDGDMFSTSEWTQTNVEAVSGAGSGSGKVTFYNMPSVPDGHWVGGYYYGHNGVNPYNPPAGRIVASSGNQITVDRITKSWKNYTGGVTGDGPGYIIKL